jgi:drug/metabolite transporter (DMT)-like permease
MPVSIVTTYNYVNPVVAVLLGWIFYREPLGWREIVAMSIIFLGVALVRRMQAVRH